MHATAAFGLLDVANGGESEAYPCAGSTALFWGTRGDNLCESSRAVRLRVSVHNFLNRSVGRAHLCDMAAVYVVDPANKEDEAE